MFNFYPHFTGKLLSVLLFFILFCTAQAFALTKTSLADGNWSDANNWSPVGVPGPSDDVIIAHDIILDVDLEVVGPFSLTINTGASLVGNSNTRRIGYDLTAGSPIVFTNNGTFTIGILNRTASGSTSNSDWVFHNYGTFNIQDNGACNGSSSSFAIGYGSFYNYLGGTVTSAGCFYVGGGSGTGLLDNRGSITFNSEFSAHSTSNFVNHPTGVVTCNGLFTAGGLNQDNYGCINALGGFRVFEKTSNNGNGTFTMHDDSKLIVAAGTQFNVNSMTTLEGVDDDNNNANNGCVSSGVQINNNGTITGEFYLNDPDGAVSGTVGGMVVLGTGDCGGSPCAAAQACSLSSAGETLETCNSNGTTPDGTDDYITLSLNPTGTGLGATYSVSVDNGGTLTNLTNGLLTGISYGSAISFRLQNGSANGTLYTITITDVSGAPCIVTTTVQQNSCSTCAPIPCGTIMVIKN